MIGWIETRHLSKQKLKKLIICCSYNLDKPQDFCQGLYLTEHAISYWLDIFPMKTVPTEVDGLSLVRGTLFLIRDVADGFFKCHCLVLHTKRGNWRSSGSFKAVSLLLTHLSHIEQRWCTKYLCVLFTAVAQWSVWFCCWREVPTQITRTSQAVLLCISLLGMGMFRY